MALTPTRAEAARFLGHAALGYNSSDIEAVRQAGFDAWMDRQFTAWRQTSHWDWLSQRYSPTTPGVTDGDLGTSVWRRFIEGRDLLRQKITFALSEILVTSVRNNIAGFTGYGGASYLDMLEERAFGNFRDILQGISSSLFMAYYLTFRGSRKADAQGTQQPDENYARELLQLFTIGLFVLDDAGNPVAVDNSFQQAYTQADVEALARVFTGWDADIPDWPGAYARWKRPMVNSPVNFDSGAKSFSFAPGITIPAGASPQDNMRLALDAIFQHPNVGPFIGKQLIQKLVTSNPSPDYVRRVAAAFNNDGHGVRGDMKAVIKAILMDPDLLDAEGRRNGMGPHPEQFGKLREPATRLVQFAKAFNMKSKTGNWWTDRHRVWEYFRNVGQEPMKSPSVFNFYRPDYSPPGTDFSLPSQERLLGPEFQITTESSVIGYVRAMATIIGWSLRDPNLECAADYSGWLPKASDATALVNELNVLLAAGRLSPSTMALMTRAINTMPMATSDQRENRIKTAALLVMSAPEYITQK
ncbi:DUF1800 family protein [Aquabacterium sp.]|uniref:DUF1800 domain-containing protein n=1 Tax=Aquabacterium sp. TaxID=1872578 RepID=UPI0025B9E61D|nr:DUF1800 family protein [Aquabacterium sp.]